MVMFVVKTVLERKLAKIQKSRSSRKVAPPSTALVSAVREHRSGDG